MVFAVDFGTRPIDHFLPPSAHGDGGRTVMHDSSTWTSGDTVPGGPITLMDDLRATLQCIREVATEWYPREIADVFAAVCADATSRALNNAPTGLVHAMVNLYTHVFSRLFIAISQNADPASLAFQTQRGCEFRSCKYAHDLEQLPEEVVTYATGKYGPLASGHPNLST
eukprot:jgi/Phyca11/548264/estExt2_Genewise1Plus.C_PHYCAscaffold_280153